MEIKQTAFRGSHARAGGVVKKMACALLASSIMHFPALAQDYTSLAKKLVSGENVNIAVKAQKARENVYQQLQKLQMAVDARERGAIVVVKNVRSNGEELNYTFEIIIKKPDAKKTDAQIKDFDGKSVKKNYSGPNNPAKKNESVLQKNEGENENVNKVFPEEKEGLRKRIFPKEEEGPVKGPSWQKPDSSWLSPSEGGAIKGLPVEGKTGGAQKEIDVEEKPLIEKDSSFASEQALDSAKIDTNIVKKKNGKTNLLAYADKLSDDGKFEEAVGIYENRIGTARYTFEVQLKIARNLVFSARQAVGNNLFENYEDEKNANLKAYVYYDDAIRILKKLEAKKDISKKEKYEIRALLSSAYRGRGVCGSYYRARNYGDRSKDIDSSQHFWMDRWESKNNLKR